MIEGRTKRPSESDIEDKEAKKTTKFIALQGNVIKIFLPICLFNTICTYNVICCIQMVPELSIFRF